MRKQRTEATRIQSRTEISVIMQKKLEADHIHNFKSISRSRIETKMYKNREKSKYTAEYRKR